MAYNIGNEKIRILLNQEDGTFCAELAGGRLLHMCTEVRLKDGRLVRSTDLWRHEVSESEGEELTGACRKAVFIHTGDQDWKLVQEFCIYEDYITASTAFCSGSEAETNYIAPFCPAGEEGEVILGDRPLRFLSAPFDNDKWAKFVEYPVAYSRMSYEFTVLHEENSEGGLVLGSVDHDHWKTGFTATANENSGKTEITAVCGAATEDTRDLNGIRHGYLRGTEIKRARIFAGSFASWQEGLKLYGRCNAAIRPALSWKGPVPFGWNSYAALMPLISYEKYKEASDFMKSIQDTFHDAEGMQYIDYDAGWERFTNRMKDTVEYAEANNQKPGAYFSPFIVLEPWFEKEVPGTGGNYLYRDLLLRDEKGEILPPVDGLYSLDATHPGVLEYMEYVTGKLIQWGYKLVKTDFVGHGCREGVFYNKDITTGVEAYNYGMSHFVRCLSEERAGYPILISLSIAPIMPHGYGHARRISCDSFGSLDQSAYLNNCITYLWWMNDCLYRFNDPDHIVTYKTYDKHSTTLEEGITRYNTGVICGGLMLASDDYGIPEARRRSRLVLTNEEVNEAAAKGGAFRPVSGARGESAADVFMRQEEDGTLLGVFNYSLSEERHMDISVEKLGLSAEECYMVRDLWSKRETEVRDGHIHVSLIPAQSAILRVKKGKNGN